MLVPGQTLLIINKLAENNVGVIVISSEEDELIGLCNRILVMKRTQGC